MSAEVAATGISTAQVALAVQVFQMLVTFALGFLLWIFQRDTAQRSAVIKLGEDLSSQLSTTKNEIEDGIDDLDRRLTRVETELEHHVDAGEIRRIYDRIEAVGGEVHRVAAGLANLQGESSANARVLHEINEFLRSRQP